MQQRNIESNELKDLIGECPAPQLRAVLINQDMLDSPAHQEFTVWSIYAFPINVKLFERIPRKVILGRDGSC
jgi:hypothetical protein